MGQMVVEDLIESWQHILIALVIAMVACLIFIALMRWVATPLVWLSIVGVIVILGFCKYHFTSILLCEIFNMIPSLYLYISRHIPMHDKILRTATYERCSRNGHRHQSQ